MASRCLRWSMDPPSRPMPGRFDAQPPVVPRRRGPSVARQPDPHKPTGHAGRGTAARDRRESGAGAPELAGDALRGRGDEALEEPARRLVPAPSQLLRVPLDPEEEAPPRDVG